ncbi:nitrogen metabolite repression--responsible protein [Emericellopsis atlantica]|uniref:Nitrogen metabolite repression--responsible protein n=1 Tax=Emericellopsis atlantica TaxID=2614577 RepID=A0A9P7ZNI0_9HYPO|nr:nitrogen metabolite repression--responsible protein [Emericellopsis atlantica]KAG9255383.1 nitrogen metabolite repression--responsible protein [Emericellopsis atlantica]
MPAQINSSVAGSIPIHIANDTNNYRKQHKHSRSSYSESSPLASSRNNSVTFRPPKRLMSSPNKTIAVINAAGRQAASLIRNATAVGYHVRAQLRNLEGVIATEVSTNPNVTVFVGELYTRHKPTEENKDVTKNGPLSGVGINHDLISNLFRGAQLAFINTTFYGDELSIGKAMADAAKKAGIQHYIYSSMPDHAAYDPSWPSLPLWADKHKVEEYVRELKLPATFVYTGIYNNNFTSLLYPLFCMELQEDGSFVWQAPFHEDAKLPWLDAEHDVGPAILQIIKDGVSKWGGERIALAYEHLTPKEACEVFERGVGRPVRYVRGPIEIKVRIPAGYREQLEALEKLFDPNEPDAKKQPPYFGDARLESSVPATALELWEGPRCLEEYAREMFPLEEEANGLTWMFDDEDELTEDDEALRTTTTSVEQLRIHDDVEEEDEEDEDEGLVMRGRKRDEEQWLA